MNVLSLFDGISTGRLALEMAGIKVDEYMASEIEAAPMNISKTNWPGEITYLGDVRNVRTRKLPHIDLLIGGSPCQGFSRAGQHLNFDDPRSALFFEFARILDELRKGGVMFLLENVVMKKEWEDVITKTLGVQPIHINSRLVSAQNRPRTYWTNIPGAGVPEDRGIRLLDVIDRDVDRSEFVERDGLLFDPAIPKAAADLISVVEGEVRVKQATRMGYIVAKEGDGINLAFPTSKTRRGRVVKGKSNTLACDCEGCVYHDGVIRKFTMTELERLQTLPEGYTAHGATEAERAKAIGNGWTAEVIAEIFRHMK
ncbi:DNA cytosine methyltransferase [Flavonifractor sp. An100]|uniref:DNA cytosine methyltransferase n=1 Tax=Flavonifractor sp. An100 TaxID=1965538 RepID=UPI000B36888D|nr:DNA cytosine methyltransferase [Flavonifractor sp. An100]OUQ78763.1 hypothetical protein B5E43_07495 [Flavonifractor sp. An100]